MKKWHKAMLIIAIVAVVLGGCTYYSIGTFRSRNIAKYEKLVGEKTFLPSLSEIGAYNDYDFLYYHKHMLIFSSEAYTLRVAYMPEDYAQEKAKLDEIYAFETQQMGDEWDEIWLDPEFDIGQFHFRVLSLEDYGLKSYPKELVFIGTSDAENEIAYIYYYDPDLDYIESFPNFLETDCGWKG